MLKGEARENKGVSSSYKRPCFSTNVRLCGASCNYIGTPFRYMYSILKSIKTKDALYHHVYPVLTFELKMVWGKKLSECRESQKLVCDVVDWLADHHVYI